MQIQSFGDIKTNLFFRVIVLVMLAMAISGCHRHSTRPTAEVKPVVLPAPDTQFQSNLGRTALVVRVNLPGLNFLQLARNKGAVTSSAVAGCSAGGGDGSTIGFAVVILLDVGCSVLSTTSAEKKAKTAQKIDADLAPMLANNVLQNSLRNAVLDAAKPDGIRLAKVPSGKKVDWTGDATDYRPLAAKGVDTVLEVSLYRLFNEPRQWVGNPWSGRRNLNFNPRLPLEMRAHVRLIETRDNSMLFHEDFHYRGARYNYTVWAANQGERLTKAMKSGFDQLGRDISDRIFLLYPFAKRAGDDRYCGLAPLAPVDDKAKELTPLLSWQEFPRESDLAAAPDDMKRVRHVRYDLLVATGGNGETPNVIYRADGLKKTSYRLPMKLEPRTRYFWSVRARFRLHGRKRVTEWATSCPFENQLVVDGKIYRFYTPDVARN